MRRVAPKERVVELLNKISKLFRKKIMKIDGVMLEGLRVSLCRVLRSFLPHTYKGSLPAEFAGQFSPSNLASPNFKVTASFLSHSPLLPLLAFSWSSS